MESDTVERVTEWDSEPFAGGHAGLHELAEREFTGAVTDGGAWLFMLNGRVLGVFDGDMAQFADADGTAYAAPDRSLPLLFAMWESGGEVRGEYYTEETPLSEVDQTLQSGNFTGYVELSENVLSGDYYLVYYGGRSMPVAFVGNQGRRLTDDEAFERAADEVGIYRVRTVDLEIIDVPEPESAEEPAAAASADGSEDTATPAESDTEADGQTVGATTVATPAGDETSSREAELTPSAPDEATADSPSADGAESTATPTVEPDRAAATDESAVGREQRRATDTTGAERPTAERTPPSTAEEEDRFEAESEWRGTTTIPALDPAESVPMEADGETSGVPVSQPPAGRAEAAGGGEQIPQEEFAALEEERDRLQARVAELEAETERLGGERDRLERERDEAAATAQEVEAELDELRATVDELEGELAETKSELSAAREYVPEGDHEIAPDRAIEGTSLFVRYERKGGATLEDAHRGDAEREAVNDNIRLEHHTEFDDAGAVVDGEPFDEWLRGTMEYGFVEWLTQTFVHDVRETRNQTSMGKLFDAVPEIDRVEFRGAVELDEEAETESAAFDVVLRDRMGQPLVVTDLNDSREPATEPMLESLIRNATPVAEENERLAAAFFVTTSYYEPGALETAEEAAGSGFLSRDRHKSFVKLSRKDGYHLCLVETRDGEFHVSVPEL